jgi:hypothetical protein
MVNFVILLLLCNGITTLNQHVKISNELFLLMFMLVYNSAVDLAISLRSVLALHSKSALLDGYQLQIWCAKALVRRGKKYLSGSDIILLAVMSLMHFVQ